MATRIILPDQFLSEEILEAILARLNWRLSRSDLPEATREALTRDRDSRLGRRQENYQAVSLLRSGSDKPADPWVFGPDYGPYGGGNGK